MACHTANMAFMALKLGHPTSIVGRGRRREPRDLSVVGADRVQVPGRGGEGTLPPVKFTWYEGPQGRQEAVLPPDDLVAIMKATTAGLKDSGSLLVGDKGMLYSPNDYGASYVLLPAEQVQGLQEAGDSRCRATAAATTA